MYKLSCAVAFLFDAEYKQQFRMGKTFYQYINTVYDTREDGRALTPFALFTTTPNENTRYCL